MVSLVGYRSNKAGGCLTCGSEFELVEVRCECYKGICNQILMKEKRDSSAETDTLHRHRGRSRSKQ